MYSMRTPGKLMPAAARLMACLLICLSVTAVHGQAVEAGYRDFQHGLTAPAPTEDKSQSKLWFHDGIWWGVLYAPTAARYEIFSLDPTTQVWSSTGVGVDGRSGVNVDVLWTGQALYVASGSADLDGLLSRFSYSAATRTYSADTGFPVTVRSGGARTINIARDSTGQLWVTYQSNKQVMVNRSLGSDATWGDPFALPTQTSVAHIDDISAVIAFQGDRIGVMWSDQIAHQFRFSVHLDSADDVTWQPSEVALADPGGDATRAWSDDHINLKQVGVGATARVFAAVKTSLGDTPVLSQDDPLVMLLVRDSAGNWTSSAFGTVRDYHTRPIVLIDAEHGIVHMLASSPETGGAVFEKSCPIGDLRFTPGRGTPVIESSLDPSIDSVTSTKQNLDAASGMVALATDQGTGWYLHRAMPLTSRFFNTLAPVADARVRSGQYADTNYGAGTLLEVRTAADPVGDGARDSYLRFAPVGVTGTPLSALLRLKCSYAAPEGGTILGVHAVEDTTWDETAITWNNRPAMGAPLSTVAVSGTANAFRDLDVSSHVLAQLAASAGLVSLGLHNPNVSATPVRADSREQNPAPARPRLEVLSEAPLPVPEPPTALAAALQTGPQVALVWTDNAANEAGFAIERSDDGGAFAPLTMAAANSAGYTDASVLPSHSYAYRVRAVNDAGASAWALSGTVAVPGPPLAPLNLTAAARLAGKKAVITVRWQDNSNNETGFVLERCTDGLFATNVTAHRLGANATTYNDQKTVARRTVYYYRVQAYNSLGVSGWSDVVKVLTP